MQIHTAAPRDLLTEAQVLHLLQGSPNIEVAYGADLLNLALQQVGEIPLLGGSVRRNIYANIHGTCDLQMDVDINYGGELVKPWMSLSDGNITARWDLGVYSLATPEAQFGQQPRLRQVQGYDRLYLLSREVGKTWVAPKNAGVLSEVRRAIAAAGLTGVQLDSTMESATLPEAMIWPLINRVDEDRPIVDQTKREQRTGMENAVTWLRVINDLLFSIGYRGLYADPATGIYRSGPYVAPEDRLVEHVFDFDDPKLGTVDPVRTLTEDRFKAPNVWIFVRQNMPGDPPAIPEEGKGIYTVDKSFGDTRALRWPTQIPLDVASQSALVSQGNNRVAADRRIESRLSVSTAPFPAAGHADIYRYKDTTMGKDVKVQSIEYEIDLGGGNMSHQWEEVA